jgi:hypothetical protein
LDESVVTAKSKMEETVEAEEAAQTAAAAWDKAEIAVKAYRIAVESRSQAVEKAGLASQHGNRMIRYIGDRRQGDSAQQKRSKFNFGPNPNNMEEESEAAFQGLIDMAKDQILTEVAAASKATVWLWNVAKVAVEVAVRTEIAAKKTIAVAETWAKIAVESAVKAMAAEAVLNAAGTASTLAIKAVVEFTVELSAMAPDMVHSRMGELVMKGRVASQAVVAEMAATVDVAKEVTVARAMAIVAAESWAKAKVEVI